MAWKTIATETFSREIKKYKKNNQFMGALEKKIQRIKKDPVNVGGRLAGRLHGYKSTRIIKKYRLVFLVDEVNSTVLLIGIDHRKFDYKNF